MTSDVIEVTCASARSQLAAGDCSGAIDRLSDAVAMEPDAGKLWTLLGVAQWSVGAVHEAIASLETALTLTPLDAPARLALALGYEVIQKQDLANGLLESLLAEKDLPLPVLEPLARALGRGRRPALALEVCRRAAALDTDSPLPLRGVAFYMAQLGRGHEEIVPVLLRALRLDPTNFNIRIQLARRLRECDRTDEAARLLSPVAIESSRCPSCLRAMREIFEEVGDEHNASRCEETLSLVADLDD